jgi:hypothetical protein
MGLQYQWSLDFVGPLNLTLQHNRYVLVMIEHFSKWLELVMLLDHSSEGAIYAFLDKVLSRLGLQPKFSLTKVHNFVGNSKFFVK